MRWIPLVVLIILGLLFWRGLSNDPRHLPSVLIGKPAPAIAGMHYDFKNQISLFNVWATWCTACEEEHEMLLKISGETKVKVYGLNYKDDSKKAELFLKQRGNPYTKMVNDPDGRIGIEWGVSGAPETFLIDQQGIVRYRHTGTLTEAVWREKFEPLLRELKENK